MGYDYFHVKTAGVINSALYGQFLKSALCGLELYIKCFMLSKGRN